MKRKAIFLLYRVLEVLASPAVLVYLLWRIARNPAYLRTVRERIGGIPASWQQTVPSSIWLHAISVGEVLAAATLLEEIRARAPRIPVFVSTGTLAGRETAQKRLGDSVAGVFYAPLDYVWCVRRVLRTIRPSVVVILETEIWPNLYREAKRIGCGLILVNGRISDRALPRYRGLAPVFRVVLHLCDSIFLQSNEMYARFLLAGAPVEKLRVAGNLKYDFKPAMLPEDSPVGKYLRASADRPLWIAASTSADDSIEEETFVIAAQRQLPQWRLVIAPRKPDRFNRVAALLEGSGLIWTRRTSLTNVSADVLLLDSIGELSALFAFASVVFMGGTIADRGGHNILEPAVFGKPVIAGPHLENFRDIADHFESRNALKRIASGTQLASAVVEAAAEAGLGERAREAAEVERGASARTADAVLDLYQSSYPSDRDPQPLYGFLWVLSRIWKYSSARDRRRKAARRMKLPVPVVSIGNITTGGTGKTPIAIELLRAFRERKAGLLTRGHGRSSSENILFRPGDLIPATLTGDEPQLAMRAAQAPIGIGKDRYAVGMELLEVEDVRMFLLDDGFQHLQLHQDFDLVVVDALRPFGGGDLVPLGRLREPLEGLARADAFVITRSGEVPNVAAIEAVLRRYNPGAPIFHSRTIPVRWCGGDGNTCQPKQLLEPGDRALAFCGVGNPQSFRRTLQSLSIEPVEFYAFSDHHRYSPAEIRRLHRYARDVGATHLLTTGKDAVNLEPDYAAILKEVKLHWLEIGIEMERRGELLRLILTKTGMAL